jgi:hypothetical protein
LSNLVLRLRLVLKRPMDRLLVGPGCAVRILETVTRAFLVGDVVVDGEVELNGAPKVAPPV